MTWQWGWSARADQWNIFQVRKPKQLGYFMIIIIAKKITKWASRNRIQGLKISMKSHLMRAIIIVLIPTISHSSLTSLGLELHEMKKKKILLEEKSNPGKEEGKKRWWWRKGIFNKVCYLLIIRMVLNVDVVQHSQGNHF